MPQPVPAGALQLWLLSPASDHCKVVNLVPPWGLELLVVEVVEVVVVKSNLSKPRVRCPDMTR